MNRKCWICDNKTIIKSLKTRDNKRRIINICLKCDFYFFKKSFSDLVTSNKFEKARLGTAGLKIPTLKADFKNGLIQSHGYVKRFISKSDRSKNILEIGCSWGYFLKLLKQRGIKAVGLEINPIRAAYVSENLDIPCYQQLESIEKKKITFHKIFLFYTIQYIPQPREYFNRLLNLLEKNGTIYLVTPNLNDILNVIWKNKRYAEFFFEKKTVACYSVTAIKRLMTELNRSTYISYHLETCQEYSFLNHLNWYFTGKPRTTGIVGGDRYVADVSKILCLSKKKLGRELNGCLKEFDSKYRVLIEKYNLGNQMILKIKKRNTN